MASKHARRRTARLSSLSALAQTLNRSSDLREALDESLTHIVELLGLQTGWIFLRDETLAFSLAARHNLPPALAYPGPPWLEDCRCQELCAGGHFDRAVNIVTCSRLRRAIGDKWGLAQHASVPVFDGDELIGILNVATTEWGDFSHDQLELLSTVGLMLGTAIVRTLLHEQVRVRRLREQAALIRLSQDLLVSDAHESNLQRLVRVGARLLETDACAFIEADDEGARALLRAAHGWKLPDACAWPLVLDPQVPHLWYLPQRSPDLPRDAHDDLPPLLRQQRFRGHLSVFVDVGDVPVGLLVVNTHAPRQFLEDEAQLLGLLGSQLAQTIERERLHQEALERRSLERELELARDIQTSFLPGSFPSVPGYDLAAYYGPARQVGGDFYDLIELHTPETRLGIVIADVTDKGVPAALFMALSRTLLRATAIDGRPPAEVLARTNRLILADSRAGLFVTCFYALLDSAAHELVYADGGHNYPLLHRAATGEIIPLRAQGIVLGVVPQPAFEQYSVTLERGDVVLFYTDGITEAMDSTREMFGEHRLTTLLSQYAHCAPRDIIDAVLAAVQAFVGDASQSDDMTLVVLQRFRRGRS